VTHEAQDQHHETAADSGDAADAELPTAAATTLRAGTAITTIKAITRFLLYSTGDASD
jgi:hypothetical protein